MNTSCTKDSTWHATQIIASSSHLRAKLIRSRALWDSSLQLVPCRCGGVPLGVTWTLPADRLWINGRFITFAETLSPYGKPLACIVVYTFGLVLRMGVCKLILFLSTKERTPTAQKPKNWIALTLRKGSKEVSSRLLRAFLRSHILALLRGSKAIATVAAR